jgi:hypothetical protein
MSTMDHWLALHTARHVQLAAELGMAMLALPLRSTCSDLLPASWGQCMFEAAFLPLRTRQHETVVGAVFVLVRL